MTEKKNVVEKYIDNHPYRDLIILLDVLRTDLNYITIEIMFPTLNSFSKEQLEILKSLTENYLNDVNKIYQNRNFKIEKE